MMAAAAVSLIVFAAACGDDGGSDEQQQIMRDEGGTIIPWFRNFVYANRTNVMHDEKLSGNWALDGARGGERWWFA